MGRRAPGVPEAVLTFGTKDSPRVDLGNKGLGLDLGEICILILPAGSRFAVP
jgi:hypothetical protein